MIYGSKLQNLRERVGLTQKEAGKLINLDSGTYSHYEKEDILIPTKHLNTFCNYYNVTFDYIFNFIDYTKYENYKEKIDKIIAGKRLKEFRKNNKITQARLAEELNTVQPVIANYEKGKHLIATPFLYEICKKYKISADYLLGKIDYIPKL